MVVHAVLLFLFIPLFLKLVLPRVGPFVGLDLMLLQVYLTTIHLPSTQTTNDSYVWLVDGVSLDRYSANHTREAVRQGASTQPWSSNVWFKGAIPKHSFLMWLTHLDRLPTRDRLVNWGMNITTLCCLCNSHFEDMDHLFLRCEWSAELWSLCLIRLGYSGFGFHTWTAFSHWLSVGDGTAPTLLKRLVSHATIYSIWSDNISTTPTIVFKILDRFIRDAILSKRNQRHNCSRMQLWLAHK